MRSPVAPGAAANVGPVSPAAENPAVAERGSTPGLLLAAARVLARDPGALKFGPGYVRSLLSDKSPLDMRIPWLTYRAIEWLEDQVGPTSMVFEYGSGGSTLFFASHARYVTSVEHDEAWYEATRAALTRAGVSNYDYMIEPPRETEADEAPIYLSSGEQYAAQSFRAYASAIDAYNDRSFDFVLVDGRARPACAHHGAPKVRPGGYLILDDAQRSIYSDVAAELRDWRRLDFPGPAPKGTDISLTSVWQAPTAS
jgi:predicted O-methyltransferase YrrM